MSQGGENIWQSISDMMTGLMLLFMFITVLYLGRVEKKEDVINEELNDYVQVQASINDALQVALGDSMKKMGAEILDDNTIRFNEKSFMFEPGSAHITPEFKKILNNFFPEYVENVYKFKDDIEELRIEGHTSSDWNVKATFSEKYLKNVTLSQARASAILAYCFKMKGMEKYQLWLTKVLRANGLAFSNPIYKEDGKTEDQQKSRRVEFKVRANAEQKLQNIAEATKGKNLDAKRGEEKKDTTTKNDSTTTTDTTNDQKTTKENNVQVPAPK